MLPIFTLIHFTNTIITSSYPFFYPYLCPDLAPYPSTLPVALATIGNLRKGGPSGRRLGTKLAQAVVNQVVQYYWSLYTILLTVALVTIGNLRKGGPSGRRLGTKLAETIVNQVVQYYWRWYRYTILLTIGYNIIDHWIQYLGEI